MNKNNLIQLGALAQRTFNMRENFKIMEVPSDSPSTVRIAMRQSLSNIPYGTLSTPLEFDDVILTSFGTQNNYEFASAGYSHKENLLVIREDAH